MPKDFDLRCASGAIRCRYMERREPRDAAP